MSQRSPRIESVDTLRGFTVAAMLLVNNPGSWRADRIHPPLAHATWNGCTFTDLIFPTFLFLVGVSLALGVGARERSGGTTRSILAHATRRSLALVLLGWWGSFFSPLVFPPEWTLVGALFRGTFAVGFCAVIVGLVARDPPHRVWIWAILSSVVALGTWVFLLPKDDVLAERVAGLRIFGVLPRIGVVYLMACGLYVVFRRPWTIALAALLALGAYTVWMLAVPIPGFENPRGGHLADLELGFPTAKTPPDRRFSNWCFYLDHHVLGEHVWGARKLRDPATGRLLWSFDPEGLLSTLSALSNVLVGILAGLWLRRAVHNGVRIAGLLAAGAGLWLLGLALTPLMPLNKHLWTTSFAIHTTALATLGLGMFHALAMVPGASLATRPLDWFGRNAIVAFVGSGMLAQALARGPKAFIQEFFDAHLAPIDASLAYAIAFVLVWTLLVGLLAWRKIYVRL